MIHTERLQQKMKKSTNQKAVLSIETTTGGGSLSLLEKSREIYGWSGAREISKAEDVLEQISELFRVNQIEKKNVELICVSTGTGSSTGEKIGRAIGKGLAKAYGCSLVEVSILESLLLEIENETNGEYLTALYCGKNTVCWQKFIKKEQSFFPISLIEVSEAEQFFVSAKSEGCKKIVAAIDAPNNLPRVSTEAEKDLFVEIKSTLANLNGRLAIRRHFQFVSDNVYRNQ